MVVSLRSDDVNHGVALSILDAVCSLSCVGLWFAVLLMAIRRFHRLTATLVQERLEAWAAENGYTIVYQERPAGFNGFTWMCFTNDVPWAVTQSHVGFGFPAMSYSTRVTTHDVEGRSLRGTFEY